MILLLISLSKQKESENSESYKSLLGKIKADDDDDERSFFFLKKKKLLFPHTNHQWYNSKRLEHKLQKYFFLIL